MDNLIMSSIAVRTSTFKELVEFVAGADVHSLALSYPDYRRFSAGGESDDEMVHLAADSGVRVVDIEALFGVLEPDPDGRTAAHAERLFRVAELFRAGSIGTHSNFDGDLDVAAQRLADLCKKAGERGIVLGVEPVAVMSLSDLSVAWTIIQHSGCANVGLVLDTWHFWRGAGTLEMIRSLPAHAFKTVQISDGSPTQDPELDYLHDALANRLPPGEGELDLIGIAHALADIGAYQVTWEMEISSSVLDALPGAEAARRAAQATRDVLTAAGWPQSVDQGQG
jgi:sugar phosphate isomerase/epimerase